MTFLGITLCILCVVGVFLTFTPVFYYVEDIDKEKARELCIKTACVGIGIALINSWVMKPIFLLIGG